MEGTVKTKRVAGIALEKSGKIRRLRTKPGATGQNKGRFLKRRVVGERGLGGHGGKRTLGSLSEITVE